MRGLKEQMEGGHKSIESPQRVSVSDLGRIVTGKTPSTKNPAFWGGEYQFVTPSDLEWKTYYCRSTERCVTEEAKQKHTKQFIPSDAVMVTCIGNTIGKCGISATECLTNQQINTIVLHEGIDPKFVYYLIVHNIGLIRGVGVGGGAATPIINKSTFSKIRLKVPSRRTWKTIASILSAYDDLIENTRRRIQLLEQAARLLYKEWFIHFRFPACAASVAAGRPGHEHVKIKNGLPEGWKRQKLGQVAEVNRASLSKNYQGKIEYVDISAVTPGMIKETKLYDFKVAPSRARRIVQHGDIIWSCVRPNRRSHAVIWHPPENLVVSTGFAVITPISVPTTYLYQAVTTDEFVGYLANNARGAAYPAVTAKDFEEALITVPQDSLLEQFNAIMESIQEQIYVLHLQARRLAKARDLLLPRLMNGEIAV
ncbi:hypothetical protein DRQ11_10630 [candidate division KSB1 bacterium]|nr:MAG: hypothetical protein DRQ11_10630 [candidate division KSB1 bacterium]